MSIRNYHPREYREGFYAGPKFSAGRLRGTDGKSYSFAGNLFATEGRHIAAVLALQAAAVDVGADVNGDGAVGVAEALHALQKEAGGRWGDGKRRKARWPSRNASPNSRTGWW